MSEVTPDTNAGNQTPTPTGGAIKFAGKYDTPEAFEKGFREGSAKAGFGISEKAKLYGDGGVFADIKAAEDAYKNIERMITAKGQSSGTTTTTTQNASVPLPQEQVVDDDADLDAIIKKAGLSSGDIGRAFLENGKLTEDQYAAIKKAMPGATKKVIDTVIGAQAQAAKAKWQDSIGKAQQIAGGDSELKNLMQWAKGNIDAATLEPLTQQASKNPDFYPGFVKFIANEYAAKNGTKPVGNGVGPRAPVGNAPAITTRAEYRDLLARVEKRDPEAIAQFKTLDISKFTTI